MKVYRLEVMVIDFDDVGDSIGETLQNGRFPNRCIHPDVMSIESRDIGEWSDDHPLNHTDKQADEFKRLFSTAKTKKENCPYDSHADDCDCRGVGGDR